ncbi:MAG: hypothetical protein DRP20_03795 [Thermotogae bacterium]|nr:MAG: hypothetical protein DRP20_03795 [Thermotogota bacterium]
MKGDEPYVFVKALVPGVVSTNEVYCAMIGNRVVTIAFKVEEKKTRMKKRPTILALERSCLF